VHQSHRLTPLIWHDDRHVDEEAAMTADGAALLTAARDGHRDAWDAIVAEYEGMVWSVARIFRLDHADAADAVQLTWLRLVENLDRIDDPSRLAGWLATTVRRECLQVLRRGQRVQPADEQLLVTVPDPGPDVDAALLTDERDASLWRAFRTLGEKCQQLLRILMASPPPSYQDVAAALDIAVGTIGPARQRCLVQLRQRLGADPAWQEDPA
jgi:RNA polymerase sigma factor (sigma-70 family)